jgi:FMN phosphatase YigB (HAD superfamily)
MPSAIRAVIFDAGHTLLEMDYPELTAYLRSRGHAVDERAVVDAERRARIRLDTERAAQPAAGRTGEGRYVRYLMEHLAITDESERHAVAEWRRGFNIPVGLCHRPDPEAARALRRARRARLVIGVLSNSNGSVRRALERAGLARYLDLVVDSSEVSMAKPDPRIFELAVDVTGVSARGDGLRRGLVLRRRGRRAPRRARRHPVRSRPALGRSRLPGGDRALRGRRPHRPSDRRQTASRLHGPAPAAAK